jgi:uncharacterized protein YdeI (YjbR/CyaY-like superfamily)
MLFKAVARQCFELLTRVEQRNLLAWLDEAADAKERKARIQDLLNRLQSGEP